MYKCRNNLLGHDFELVTVKQGLTLGGNIAGMVWNISVLSYKKNL